MFGSQRIIRASVEHVLACQLTQRGLRGLIEHARNADIIVVPAKRHLKRHHSGALIPEAKLAICLTCYDVREIIHLWFFLLLGFFTNGLCTHRLCAANWLCAANLQLFFFPSDCRFWLRFVLLRVFTSALCTFFFAHSLEHLEKIFSHKQSLCYLKCRVHKTPGTLPAVRI